MSHLLHQPKAAMLILPRLSGLMNNSDTFDPHGDLTLEVGEQKAVSLVCSRSLARASPIFNSMLFGNFAESKPAEGDWRVKLPEDDPYALCLLLDIIHGRFDRASNSICCDADLYRVTILSDKYDMTHILQPWAAMWLQGLKNTREDFTSRISIAWELGDYNLFATECDNLYRNSAADSDGNLLDKAGARVDACPMLGNLDILESLVQARQELIKSLVAPVDKLLRDLLSVGGASPRIPPQCTECAGVRENSPVMDEAKSCDAIVLGTLLKALISADLYPLPEPSSYTKTVSALYTQLNEVRWNIQCLRLDCGKYPGLFKHTGCNPSARLWSAIDAAFRAPHSIITEKHKSHLRIQAKRSGILVAPELRSLYTSNLKPSGIQELLLT